MAYDLEDDSLGSRISAVLHETTMDHRGTLNNQIAEIIDNSNNSAENS